MWLLAICLVNLSVLVFGQENPAVSALTGRIHGIRGDDFDMFLGVPYGQVDEKNPFGAATPQPVSTKSIYAYRDPVICPQTINGVPQGSIHCLYLNIYVPHNTTIKSQLPVMVFLHGGGFVSGDGNLGSYSPKFLIQHNVIVVTVNYRLGIFGFLCLPDSDINNQGLKDQKLALNWVKNNIHMFGGNAKNIVLFGHSAGSISAEIQLLYNKDAEIDKFILQSGPAVSPLIFLPPAGEEYMRKVARKLHFDVENKTVTDVLNVLSDIDTNLLTKSTKGDDFPPCIDGKFIQKKPKVNVGNKKIMVGCTDREMLFFYQDIVTLEMMIAAVLKNSSVDDNMPSVYKPVDSRNSVLNFGNDLFFEHPIARSVRLYSGNGAKVYKYLFTYDGGRNYLKVREHINCAGATHGDELGYLFDMNIFIKSISSIDQILINDMTAMWTNFAHHGNPTPANSFIVTTNNATLTWPSVDSSKKILNIGQVLTVQDDRFTNKMKFWTNVYKEKPIPGIDFGDIIPSSASSTKVSIVAIVFFCIVRALQF